MYISGIDYESIADGDGVRCTIFVSGCEHNCKGCHSPKTHSFTNGIELTDELVEEINSELDKRPFLSGITLSGGDPMYSAKECVELLDKLHIPCNNIWVFSGFTYDEIVEDEDMRELLKRCDVLVDGPYIESRRNVACGFRGSDNQCVIYIDSEDIP